MKILAIDDQQLVLLPLRKRLTELGYVIKVETNASKGLELYDSFKPDLVIVDINMPGLSGIEIIKCIRERRKSQVPIMVLSGNVEDDMITKSFDLGVNDYMKKPLSLNEVCARIKRLIGVPKIRGYINKGNNVIIQQRCVGVVIPCYNEEERLLSNQFLSFIDKNSGYHLCFVNDGSTDSTLDVLKTLRKGRKDYITVYDCEKNGGKSEAVRLGMLHMANHKDLDYIGFLDADLSTDLSDFDDLVSTIENSNYKIVSGSRISRMGADIAKESARQIISLSINFVIRKILSMQFKDTQCGAKIFNKDVIQILFKDKFITKWLFDVEIFLRMKRYYTVNIAKELICEKPLKRWVHVDGSKLSMKDSVRIIGQLVQIAFSYRKNKSTVLKGIINKFKHSIVIGSFNRV
ncbi:MAG: CheY-like chemotaxis protein/glycosyltransferase involved in cell wall biosynthesis [Polaribacter sp.]|jgi:CheY-like chemotaxis protein/glycosyltransferase involved in cell wall biosynthesis